MKFDPAHESWGQKIRSRGNPYGLRHWESDIDDPKTELRMDHRIDTDDAKNEFFVRQGRFLWIACLIIGLIQFNCFYLVWSGGS